MDWVMCLLPMAVCFVGVLFSVKVSKKHKRILAAAGVMLFLCVAFGSLAVSVSYTHLTLPTTERV